MGFHYSDGSYVGGLPAFIGGLFGIAICFGLFNSGLNFFLSLLIGAAIPIGVMALFEYTPKNYSDDIIGKWKVDEDSIRILEGEPFSWEEGEPFYSWEFKKDGTMIWWYKTYHKEYNYEIKGKYIVVEGRKKFKIGSFYKKDILCVVDCKSKKLIYFTYVYVM
jgi:hypothetical protein